MKEKDKYNTLINEQGDKIFWYSDRGGLHYIVIIKQTQEKGYFRSESGSKRFIRNKIGKKSKWTKIFE